MIAAYRLEKTGQTFTIDHAPGPPDNPMLYALHSIRLHLLAAGVDLSDDLYAPLEHGKFLDEREP